MHIAASLALVSALGSGLIGGMIGGLLISDLAAMLRHQGEIGQGALAAVVLALFALVPGLACWAAGRRMMAQRGHEPLIAPRASRALLVCVFFIGLTTAWVLGVPTP